jgi:ABC-type sugar transport system ATPase subunit
MRHGGPSDVVARLSDVRKKFGPTYALKGVDLVVKKGEVHALLGRNGAGKSTLVSAISGLVPADTGQVLIAGQEIRADGRNYAAKLRPLVAHVQQTPQMFNLLSVAENLYLENSSVTNRFGVVSKRRGMALARELTDQWDIELNLDALVGNLSAESRQLLEIMKALGRGVPLIILDEPTAALSNSEKQLLFDSVNRLKGQGVSFIYISHHLDEIFEVADVATILRDGEVVLERERVDLLDVNQIARYMVGEDVVRSSRTDNSRHDVPPVLNVDGLQLDSTNAGTIDFSIRPGEIVALAGPVGGGKELVGEIIAGVKKGLAGRIFGADGTPVDVGFVPTDRHQSGYVGILGIRENISIGGLSAVSGPGGFINPRKEANFTEELARRTDVIASSIEQSVSQLSGGNQQKVVFARALCRSPRVIVALSPTRGVDVGAKEQLYQLLRDLAAEGIGILIVSDEHEEIDQIANRVIVVVNNQIVAHLDGAYNSQDLVLKMEGVS